MYTEDAFQEALGFLVAQTTYIEPAVVRIKYPELNYADFVPIDSSGNEWAKSKTFFSMDTVGVADWIHHLANDVPMADVERQKHEVGIELAGVGYYYSIEELQHAQMAGFALSTERAAAARRAYEEKCHNVAMYGDSAKNWGGLTNHTQPSITNLTTTWAAQITGNNANLVLRDVNNALTGMWVSTLTVEMADTLLLPLAATTLLSMTQLPNTTMNLLEWIMRNNVYTQQTGGALLIRGVRGLDTAGASGNGRAIVYRRTPEVVKLHRPMPHRFLTARQTGVLRFDVPGIFRLAGLEIRYPAAIRYIDGV